MRHDRRGLNSEIAAHYADQDALDVFQEMKDAAGEFDPDGRWTKWEFSNAWFAEPWDGGLFRIPFDGSGVTELVSHTGSHALGYDGILLTKQDEKTWIHFYDGEGVSLTDGTVETINSY